MYICKYINITRDFEGHPSFECPFKKRAETENLLLEKNILRPLCPDDVNGSEICYEI